MMADSEEALLEERFVQFRFLVQVPQRLAHRDQSGDASIAFDDGDSPQFALQHRRCHVAVWDGVMRWVMAGLAVLGSALLGITGTLGGHLVGIHTEVASALRLLGWEVYTTFYVPDTTLIAIAVAVVLLTAFGLWGARRLA